MFSFDCGFNHVHHIWPDGEFNGVEWCLFEVDWNNLYQVMDHFIKVCKGFAYFFARTLLTRQVLACEFSIGVKP